MADFSVSARSGYQDIGGLVLDCRPGDFVLDGNGAVESWRNRAPALWPGAWRFGSPKQLNPTRRPTFSGSSAKFVRASQQYLSAASFGVQPADSKDVTFAFDVARGLGPPNHPQVILSSLGGAHSLIVSRLDTSDVSGFAYDVGSVVAGSELNDGAHLVGADASGAAYWSQQNVNFPLTGSLSDASFEVPSDEALRIGHGPLIALDYLDASLSGVRAWRKVLSPREQDLAWKTLAASGVDYSATARGVFESVPWTDDTGDALQRQISRLRPLTGAPQRYLLVRMPSGTSSVRVQLGCEVGGVSPPDSALGGDLFRASVVERPLGAAPVFEQDGGWSSVFDVVLKARGHYAILFKRQAHGGRIVHLDVGT